MRGRVLHLAAGILAFASPAFAQQDPAYLSSRINQLENQVQTLSRAVYRGGSGASGASAGMETPGAVAGFDERLSQIEAQQRTLTGQIERLENDVRQMKDRLDKTLADNEMRFQQVERGADTAAVASLPAAEEKPALKNVLGTLSSKGSADPAETLYESAFSDIRESKYDAAEGKLKKFMSSYPGHALAGNAQYWLGETYYVRGDYQQAARLFAQGYQDYPQGAKAPDSLLKLGLSLAKAGKKDDACLSFRQLEKEYPGSQNPAARRAVQEIKQLGCGG